MSSSSDDAGGELHRRLFPPPFCPTFSLSLLVSPLKVIFSPSCPDVVVTPQYALTHSCAKWKVEGCLPYLCSQQDIMLFSFAGSRPVFQARGAKMGLLVEAWGFVHCCVCVCSPGCSFLNVFVAGNNRLRSRRLFTHC